MYAELDQREETRIEYRADFKKNMDYTVITDHELKGHTLLYKTKKQ